MDGLDVGVADLSGADTGDLVLRPLGARTWSWPVELRERLLALLPPATASVQEVAQLDELVGRECGRAATAVLAELGVTADLVVSHGQTVFHWVVDGHAEGTLQLGQPAPIVEATGLPVISDVRARDIAAGGQGAPLAGTLDVLWLRGLSDGQPIAALNLGGIANVTVVSSDSAVAFDTGPANCLIDAAITRITGGRESHDRDGRMSRAGTVHPRLLEALLTDPYYAAAAPKSTGRELFTTAYVDRFLAQIGPIPDADLIATLTELTATTVANSVATYGISRLLVSGGGVHNPAVMDAIARHLPGVDVCRSDDFGLAADDKEAYLLALIGYLSWHQVPGVLAGMTGSGTPRVLGRISPGNAPLRLPTPGVPPRRLTVARGTDQVVARSD